jgi:hypothetical protein
VRDALHIRRSRNLTHHLRAQQLVETLAIRGASTLAGTKLRSAPAIHSIMSARYATAARSRAPLPFCPTADAAAALSFRTGHVGNTPTRRPVPQVSKPIESLAIGDQVIAWDAGGGQALARPIVHCFRHVDRPTVTVSIARKSGATQRITCTPDHPFWVDGRGWIAAQALRLGDPLSDASGQATAQVRGVEQTGQRTTVFNVEVEEVHNYFVGHHGVLVHNMSRLSSAQPLASLAEPSPGNDVAPVSIEPASGARLRASNFNYGAEALPLPVGTLEERAGTSDTNAAHAPPTSLSVAALHRILKGADSKATGEQLVESKPIGTGMRRKDFQKFVMAAKEHRVTLMVRHTNDQSLKFVAQPGYYAKPAMIKAKTADYDVLSARLNSDGPAAQHEYKIAGLVVHPGMHPKAYKADKMQKVAEAWNDNMKHLGADTLVAGHSATPESWAHWGVARPVACAPDWQWRVDVDPRSKHYGALQLSRHSLDWSYIHGDYDLKDIIVQGKETDNRRDEGHVHGVKNYTPRLDGPYFESIRSKLNQAMGADMVQHGAEAQFGWHGDEPITVIYPDGTHKVLGNALAVQRWYEEHHRPVLAKPGKDYGNSPDQIFFAGPHGIRAPETPER